MSISSVDPAASLSARQRPAASANKRLLWIESLRGLAVVAVVPFHLFPDHAFAFLGSGKYFAAARNWVNE